MNPILSKLPHIILMGPSGSGKDTIAKGLCSLGFERNVTYTTRPQRTDEFDGVDYHFIDDERFDNIVQNNIFAETVAYEASFGKCRYGSIVDNYRGGMVSILTPTGYKQIYDNHHDIVNNSLVFVICSPMMMDYYNKQRLRDHIEEFVYLPNDPVLCQHLKERGDDSSEIRRRLVSDSHLFSIESLNENCLFGRNFYFIPNYPGQKDFAILSILEHSLKSLINSCEWR